MPVCDNVNNPREEYVRTKTGYIHQWQTQVEGNVMKKKQTRQKIIRREGNFRSPLVDVYNKQNETHKKSMHFIHPLNQFK
jgi:ribosomal protein L36